MNPVKIITDSTSSLSSELIKKYDISVVPLYVVFDEESYKDGIEIDEEKLYKKVEEKGKLPKTAAPSPMDFYNEYKLWIDKGYDIVSFSISSHFSSAVQNARIAANDFPKDRIFVVDSLNLSSGIGLLALQACEYALQGMDAKTIYQKINELIPKVRSSFIIDTLDYLHMGGRCTALAKWTSSVLKIHPRIIVSNGKMIVGEKFKGKRETILKGLLQTALVKKDKIDTHRVFISHTFATKEDIEYLKNGLENVLSIEDLLITDSGCVVATHCGKKTIGILYIEKEN